MNREEISIGREPSNEISFLDSSVSRRHCLIRKEGEVFQIRDLESRNGTFVNGVPLKERILEHTDQIQIGSSVLVFLTSDAARESFSSVQLDVAGPACPTVILRKGDALYLKPPEEFAHLPVTARGVRELNALSNFSRAVNSVRSVEALQKKVLESLLEIAPAVRAAILLTDDSTGEFISVLGWDRSLGPNQPVRVSQTIAAHVLEEGVAVLCNDIPEDADFHAAESLVTPGIRSVLAVPLAVFDKTIGLLYLDADDPKMKFDRGLLELVTALGNVAALAIENARHFEWLEGENQRLRQELNIEHNMIGESPAMRDVYNFISKVAARESSVLIWGESGTGKELVARAIHRNSGRAAKPFVAINCAAIAETLLESELFGHEKGAFTGAVAQKRGKLELADGGTVFLDEIGELALPLQSKLLRVLQEREVERVGRDADRQAGYPAGRRYQSRSKGRRAQRDLPRRSVLPAERSFHPGARASRAAGRHIPAGQLFHRPVGREGQPQGDGNLAIGAGLPNALRLAGQRPGTRERHRARRRAGVERGHPSRGSPGWGGRGSGARRRDRNPASRRGSRSQETGRLESH